MKRPKRVASSAPAPASANEAIIRQFASQFTPPLMVGQTEQINNVKVRDGWVATDMRSAADGTEIGFTAVAWGNGQFKAFCEIVGGVSVAVQAGKAMAKVLE